jgi:hypothetical protein
LIDRHQQFNLASDYRHDFDRMITKLTEWIKTTEQQIKDPFTNDLQQTANILKEKLKSVQVRNHQLFSQPFPDYLLVFTSIYERSFE